MSSQRHIIHKLNLELEFTGDHNVRELSDRIYTIFKKEILPLIETLLEKISRSEEIIRINELVIDAGPIDPEFSDSQIAVEVIRQMEEQLTTMVPRQGFKRDDPNNGVPNAETKQSQSRTQALTAYRSRLIQFMHFMKTGSSHWSMTNDSFPEWEQSLVESLIEQKEVTAKEMWPFILNLTDSQVKRLVYQFSPDFLLVLIRLFFEKQMETVKAFRKEADVFYNEEKALKPLILPAVWRQAVWVAVFHFLQKRSGTGKQKEILLFQNFINFLSENTEPKAISAFLEMVLQRSEKNIKTTKQNYFSKLVVSQVKHTGKKGQSSKIIKKPSDPIPFYKDSGLEDVDEFFIRNAGVILLHPFFKPFFADFDLLDNEEFINETAREQAVGLLHFLATGENKVPEYDLTLCKVLVGLKPDHPIGNQFNISSAQKKEADNLLRTAIRYWDKLKKTSPDGLREGFLKRNGKLSLKEEGWVLQVEPMTQDILLEYLPWNISIIKLPWREKVLRVEWTA